MNLPEYQSKSNPSQRRLGERLLAAGLINSEQLDEAIEYQCLYGGKLGTSLIELNLIDEDCLAKVLSQQLKLHYIKPELLMNVPGSILSLIPQKIALKYQIVPYHKNGKKLYVAMNEASNLSNIDDLSFQLNHIIVPLAIPEIRLFLALKKHYGMLLSPRFETLAAQINKRMLATRKTVSKQPQEDKAEAEPIAEPNAKIQLEDETTWPLLGEETYAEEEPAEESYFSNKSASREEPSLGLLQQLVDANERDDIARAIIGYLKKDFPASALMMVRNGMITGWLAATDNTSQHFEQINIPIQDYSVFSLVATSHSPYLGPVTDSLQNRKILNYFDSQPPQNALVIPLIVRDRLVSILYIQGNLENLERYFTEMQNIADKIKMSFSLLILKSKILTT